MDKTYKSWMKGEFKSEQREYTEDTRLLSDNGTLLASGWARKNVFSFDRNLAKPRKRLKEWDFYQISNGRLMAQVSFANISIGGYASAVLVDIANGKKLAESTRFYLGGMNKYILPPKGDVPSRVEFNIGKAHICFDTSEKKRIIEFKNGDVSCMFEARIIPDCENITTVLPFKDSPNSFFMTTKLNSMPTKGFFRSADEEYTFDSVDTFTVLDWGRVCTPYSLVWYWGNGSARIKDDKGKEHIFGFEITWGIGDESHATETCLFFDGKAHKIGAVDVVDFPKPDGYMKPWHFISEDGRLDLVMTPFYDHHSDMNALVLRMNSHQVHGLWNGHVVLDDGTTLEIKDMYAFCEYVENRW